jgi:hypothetical protein
MLVTKFDELVYEAISIASLSPSSHNCQPWGLILVQNPVNKNLIENFLENEESSACKETKGNNYLIITLDKNRCLNSLAAHTLEMLLSCGAFIEALVLAFTERKIEAVPCWHNSNLNNNPLPKNIKIHSNWIPLSLISIIEQPETPIMDDIKEKIAMINQRITNRGLYKNEQISSEIIQNLTSLSSVSYPGIEKKINICLIQEPGVIKQISSFIKENSQIEFTENSVWKETYKYIRFGNKEIEQSNDGLPITQLFGPMPEWLQQTFKLILSPICMQGLKRIGIPNYFSSQLAQLIANTSLLGYLSFKEEEPSIVEQLGGGAIWLNLCLNATLAGLSIHPVSVILQHPHLRLKFQKDYHLPAGRGFFFTRIGYPLVSFPSAPKIKNLAKQVQKI